MEDLTSETVAVFSRSLTVSRADLDQARAGDRLTGGELSDVFPEDMLADPMVRLVTEADGISAAHLRHRSSGSGTPDPNLSMPASNKTTQRTQDDASILAAENEGMPPRPESPSPLRSRFVAGAM